MPSPGPCPLRGTCPVEAIIKQADGFVMIGSDLHRRVSPRERLFGTRQSAFHLGEWWLLKPHNPKWKAPVW